MGFGGFVFVDMNNEIVYDASKELMQRLALEAAEVAMVSGVICFCF